MPTTTQNSAPTYDQRVARAELSLSTWATASLELAVVSGAVYGLTADELTAARRLLARRGVILNQSGDRC